MGVLFVGLNDKQDGWEYVGVVEDGAIADDPTGELTATLEGSDLTDEEHLCRRFNGVYLNAVLVESDTQGERDSSLE